MDAILLLVASTGGGSGLLVEGLTRQLASNKFAASRPDEHLQSQRRQAEYYLRIASAADALPLKGGDAILEGLRRFDTEWGNIRAGQAWAAALAAEDDDAARLASSYPDAGVYCLSLRQHPRGRILWLEVALAAARRLKDRTAEGVHLGNMGIAYKALGETCRAIEFYEDQLVVARDMGDRRGEGNALWNFSLAFDKLGERAQAIVHAEAALKIYEAIEDPNAARVRAALTQWRGQD